jgi:tetratricopeptide (TPR) repeat protein
MHKAFRIQVWRAVASAFTLGLVGSLSGDLIAQTPMPLSEDAAIARAFGNGAHAFFDGNYQQAYDSLSDAVAAGSRDPRTLYFRGLAARRLGRVDDAEADFAKAARIEADALGDWPVSRTLERVQGQDRLALERHRVRSRLEVLQERKDAAARRYSQIDSVQDSYLRKRRPQSVIKNDAAEFGTPEAAPAAQPAEPIQPGPAIDAGGASDAVAPSAEAEPEAVREAPAADAPGDAIFE